MELVPQPLDHLIRRVLREPESTRARAVFDLPAAKMWRGTPAGLDLSRRFHGERAATVVGPAAGPHTQLAQNIALSYLAGARILELKTVQILDTLTIPRPCIDATNVGFNVEWSQELRIPDSRDEYAKAALLIAALQRLGVPEGLPAQDRDHLLDLSLGYDLKGISSAPVTDFLRTMLDASAVFERLLAALPADLAGFRDLAPDPRLVSCVTLSTFHGCPAHEIEAIAAYLLETVGVHVVVKLNPTLLGFDTVEGLLHEHLGYRELKIQRKTFEADLQWSDALAAIGRLRAIAHRRGLTFGVKLTNTLVVDNHKRFFTEKEMYLSGQPLHVLATALLARLRAAVPLLGADGEPPLGYSFSAGIDQHNYPLAVAADLLPVTTCTDLLRPGGYSRLPRYHEALAEQMRARGATTIEAYILAVHGEGQQAMAEVAPIAAAELHRRGRPVREGFEGALQRAAATFASDPAADPGALLAREGVDAEAAALVRVLWLHQAGSRNAAHLARAARENRRYLAESNRKVPKKIGSSLSLFDCVNCDKCVPVCPNDANFTYTITPFTLAAPIWRVEGGAVVEERSAPIAAAETHQLATFVDFCNACGNCDVFCPEDGGPYVVKPHWFGSRAALEAEARIDGFYLESRDTIAGRLRGAPVRLTVDRGAGRATFETDGVEATLTLLPGALRLDAHRLKEGARTGEIRGPDVVVLAALLDGVQATVNPVSAALP